jgi:hypothetical protein
VTKLQPGAAANPLNDGLMKALETQHGPMAIKSTQCLRLDEPGPPA